MLMRRIYWIFFLVFICLPTITFAGKEKGLSFSLFTTLGVPNSEDLPGSVKSIEDLLPILLKFVIENTDKPIWPYIKNLSTKVLGMLPLGITKEKKTDNEPKKRLLIG